ncbi:helix-turn-helix transcriptional regulator [Streptomyces sp. NBC_00104]
MLDVFGIDARTESVYRGMLAHPESGVTGLSDVLGLSREEIRTALDRLSEMALIRPSAEDPQRMHALNPQLGMEMLIARQQAELAVQQQRVEEGRAAAARILSEFALEDSATVKGDAEHVEGLDNIRDHLAAMNNEVEDEFLTFAPGGAQTEANMRNSRPLNRRLLDRGVRMRTVYLDSIRNDTATLAHAEWLTSHGAQVRTAPSLPNRMIIWDRRVALIAANSDDTAAGVTIHRAQGTVAALAALFENVWQTAEPFGVESHPREPDGLNAQQREALRLLALGHTDEMVAKRLGVSARTARRIATTLMEHFGSRSRFQAGVRAAQQGFIQG